MKKVRLLCWWTSSENITKRTIKQFDIYSDINNHIEFVYDDSYEWLVIFGKKPENFIMQNAPDCPRNRTIFFGMEPSWSPNTDKSAPEYSKFIFTHDKNIFIQEADTTFFIEPNYMFYGGRGDDNWNLQYLNKDYPKTKQLSMIVTKRGNCWGTQNIYDDRLKLAEALLDAKVPIDMYGTFWENNGVNIFGEIWNKLIPLETYQYSIALENSREQRYITEKFYDCLLTDTIPIYYGAPNISDYFDNRGFIELKNINNIPECLETILGVLSNTDNMYNQTIQYCKNNKTKYLHQHNLLLAIQNIIYNA